MAPQKVMLRVTPGIKPTTHDYIATGQVDSKFGFGLDDVPARDRGGRARAGSSSSACTRTSARRSSTSSPYEKLAEVLTEIGDYPLLNLGGGLGIAYTEDEQPPSIDEYVETLVERRARRRDRAVRAGPLARRQRRRDDLHGRHRQGDPRRAHLRRRSTAACPTTCARCSTARATRPRSPTASAAGRVCTIAGKHCESGDVLQRDVELDDPRPGDLLVMPATGAYGHAMANNYNGIPRPPVIFCEDGDARAVVRRETYEDLALRDALASACSATGRSARRSTSCSTSAPTRSRRPPASGRRSPAC